MDLGYLNTKEYRKPEWVTHMEDMKKQLQGKTEVTMSLDSLEHVSVKQNEEETSERWISLGDLPLGDDSVFTFETSFDTQKHKDELLCDNDLEENIDNNEHSPVSFYLLPPIEENSEPSTSGSIKSDQFGLSKRQFSSSCQNIAASDSSLSENLPHRCQTFPRSKATPYWSHQGPQHNFGHANTLYPLEPRELDPDSFYQLHTADSQEELQEFLLLESQCMTTESGIAAAFLTSDEVSGMV